jgi:hypothetical protein
MKWSLLVVLSLCCITSVCDAEDSCTPIVVADDFEDEVLDLAIWSLSLSDPAVALVEEDGALRISGDRASTKEEDPWLWTGIRTRNAIPAGPGFEASVLFRSARRSPGFELVVSSTDSTLEHDYLISFEFWGDRYQVSWCNRPEFGCGSRHFPPLGNESDVPHTMTFRYHSQETRIEAYLDSRLLVSYRLPEPLELVHIWAICFSNEDTFGWGEYFVEEVRITYGCPSDTLDSDGDGVPNQDDYCPMYPGSPETNGC